MSGSQETVTRPSRKWGRRELFCCRLPGGITVSTTGGRLLGGGVFTAALLWLVLAHRAAFLEAEVTQGGLLFGLCLAACGLLAGMTLLRWRLPDKPAVIVSLIVAALLPIVAMTMAECLNGVFTWDWSPQILILNYILYFVFYGVVYALSGSLRLPLLIVDPLVFLLALTNHWVYAFRGTPFTPMDIFAAGTAANVASNYTFSLDYQIVIAILLLAFLQVAAFRLRTPGMDKVVKIASRVFCAVLAVCIVGIYAFTNQYAEAGLRPDFWNQNRGYRRTGVVMNFCLNLKYIKVSRPAGYDANAIPTIVYGLLEEETEDGIFISISDAETAPQPAKAPNIICIMNESLSDLSVLGDVYTNEDYMPFLRSLTENTVRGNLYVPVVGSGTSNTEFEFLTGASTAFFPAGSNAYMLYIKNPLESLVSTLGAQGYSKQAFHPYYSSGWNRTNVYKNLDFDRFLSIGSVIDQSILLEYQNSGFSAETLESLVEEAYPGQEVLLRRYVSDSYDYRKVIEPYEERDESQPFFLFNVTMQNHGGYTERAKNFSQQIYLTDEEGNRLVRHTERGDTDLYPLANQYLSLVKESDSAFEELLEYFAQQEEPTVICMFGDHQPNIETAYLQELLGVDSLYSMSTRQDQQRYVTPFYIWANYDIGERTVERLSSNYLSSYVLQVAGVQMPVFNQYLLKLSKTLPVIDTVGYIDAAGNYYTNGESSEYTVLLKNYEKVIYNLMFDQDAKCEELFSLEGP